MNPHPNPVPLATLAELPTPVIPLSNVGHEHLFMKRDEFFGCGCGIPTRTTGS